MPSAIANSNIFSGAAVAQSKDNASLASTSVLATHIATLGAKQRGIVSMVASGNVYLTDWTLSTGSKNLSTGATYYAGANGKLALTGGQPVGIAISPTTLSVTIQNQQQQTSPTTTSDLSSLQAQVSTLQAQVAALIAASGSATGIVSYASIAKFGTY
jgi:hypothetical protein